MIREISKENTKKILVNELNLSTLRHELIRIELILP